MSGWPFDPHHVDTTTAVPRVEAPPPRASPARRADLDCEQQQHADDLRRPGATANIVIGLLMLSLGLVITVATYSSASHNPHGGTYLVMWGPIVFGFIRLMRGLFSS